MRAIPIVHKTIAFDAGVKRPFLLVPLPVDQVISKRFSLSTVSDTVRVSGFCPPATRMVLLPSPQAGPTLFLGMAGFRACQAVSPGLHL